MRSTHLAALALLAIAALFAVMPSEREAMAACESAGVQSTATCNQYAR